MRLENAQFEIMRLDDVHGTAIDSTIVDAACVRQFVQQAAETGQRIYIRPAEQSAAAGPAGPGAPRRSRPRRRLSGRPR
jgi:hypothetical protein